MGLKAQSNDMSVGLVSDLIPQGTAILQYEDDSVLLMILRKLLTGNCFCIVLN
jgi:hypothetical protein